MQKIVPCLWFDKNAEEAVNFYLQIFRGSKIVQVSHYGEVGQEQHGMPAGTVMTIEFELNGQRFTALNGGPIFKFNEAVSLQIYCKTQEEIDYYWQHLGEDGDKSAQQCGWLKDKFGFSWQIVPEILNEWMQDKDRAKANRVMQALLQMKKLDLNALEKAWKG
ncbi:DNA binding protein [Legionella birminghamensis]|uniref:DNA binding protein n=1 Tax=Legionella birminghamensis TaxID=28083 RepID=A0A378IB03_9GAMM|nr:VOC family protein [Legionella birminghamensis]KTC75940.1 DNA binding protein [Legionella birminghamensis]STX32066.1 DNA binding protein [Legionella birminghamensis]